MMVSSACDSLASSHASACSYVSTAAHVSQRMLHTLMRLYLLSAAASSIGRLLLALPNVLKATLRSERPVGPELDHRDL